MDIQTILILLAAIFVPAGPPPCVQGAQYIEVYEIGGEDFFASDLQNFDAAKLEENPKFAGCSNWPFDTAYRLVFDRDGKPFMASWTGEVVSLSE